MDSDAEAIKNGKEEMVDETPGDLTIYLPYYPSTDYDFIIKAFNKRYPNVKVTLIEQVKNNYFLTDLVPKVSVELMSGSAGDIIDLRTQPYIQYSKNNFLEDLYPYMKNDSEFYMEDYYTNILEATEYENKLYAIPMTFYYFCVRFNKKILRENQIEEPQGDSINYQEIINIYDKISPSNDKLVISRYWDQYIMEYIESNGYFDERKGSVNFNFGGYIDYLNEVKRIRWPSEEEIKAVSRTYAMRDIDGIADINDLCTFILSSYQDKRNAMTFYDSPDMTIPIPVSATNGDKGYIGQAPLFGILSTSKNKDLAWKFIRFCIEEKPEKLLINRDEWMIGGMPINRNNTIKMLNVNFEGGEEEAVQMIDRWNSQRNESIEPMVTGILREIKKGFLDKFYIGEIAAEDCARQMQERVEIYIKE